MSLKQLTKLNNQSLSTQDLTKKISAARSAYNLGSELYGKSNINTANLALNLAVHLNQDNETRQARTYIDVAVKTYKNDFSKLSKELADLYITIADSFTRKYDEKANMYYIKAISVLDDMSDKDALFAASTKLLVGKALLNLSKKQSKVLLDAQSELAKLLPANDKRVVQAKFWAGKYYMAAGDFDDAVDSFSANLPVFDKLNGATHPLELSTHAFLVRALEGEGRSDEATKHCVAIGSMKPWDDSQDAVPLYRANPKYPRELARKGKTGYVVLSFTISESGMVKDTEVIEHKGSTAFKKPALAAVKQWRYAPKFVDGKAVSAEEQIVRVEFSLDLDKNS